MNKRKLLSYFTTIPQTSLLGLLFCSVLFAIGTVAGVLASDSAVSGGGALEFLTDYLVSIDPDTASFSLTALFLDLAKYHIVAFLLGFSMLGMLGIPLLSALRGFTLAFTVAVFTRLYSVNGVFTAYLLIGLGAVVSVPQFFTVAVQGFGSSLSLARCAFFREPPRPDLYSRGYFFRFLTVLLTLILLALGERAILSLDLPVFP